MAYFIFLTGTPLIHIAILIEQEGNNKIGYQSKVEVGIFVGLLFKVDLSTCGLGEYETMMGRKGMAQGDRLFMIWHIATCVL